MRPRSAFGTTVQLTCGEHSITAQFDLPGLDAGLPADPELVLPVTLTINGIVSTIPAENILALGHNSSDVRDWLAAHVAPASPLRMKLWLPVRHHPGAAELGMDSEDYATAAVAMTAHRVTDINMLYHDPNTKPDGPARWHYLTGTMRPSGIAGDEDSLYVMDMTTIDDIPEPDLRVPFVDHPA